MTNSELLELAFLIGDSPVVLLKDNKLGYITKLPEREGDDAHVRIPDTQEKRSIKASQLSKFGKRGLVETGADLQAFLREGDPEPRRTTTN